MHKPWKQDTHESPGPCRSCSAGWSGEAPRPQMPCPQHSLAVNSSPCTSSFPLPLAQTICHSWCFVSRARRTSRVTAQHTNTCLIHRTTKWMRWEGASWLFSLYFQMNFAPLSLCPTLQVGKGGNEFLLHLLIFRLNHPHASHTLNPASSWHVFQLKQKKKQNHQQKKYTKPKLPYQQLQIQPFGKIRIKNASKSSHLWLNLEVWIFIIYFTLLAFHCIYMLGYNLE